MNKTEQLNNKFKLANINVTEEQMEKLLGYESLLKKWNAHYNLVSPSTLPDILLRHVFDSCQLIKFIPNETKSILDFGSGGGTPSVMLATLLEIPVYACERIGKKVQFLKECRRQLDLKSNFEVIRDDVNNLDLKVDLITARAVSELINLLNWTSPLHHKDIKFLFPKGERWKEEVDVARETWDFDLETFESLTSPESRILLIKNISKKVV